MGSLCRGRRRRRTVQAIEQPIAVPAGRCHICVVCSNSWQFRPWILSLLSAHTQHLDALCADCLSTFTAAPPHQSSQPGVQSVQAPSVLRSHSSMQQRNVFTPSLEPLCPCPAMMVTSEQERTRESAHGKAHLSGAHQRVVGHALAHQSVRKQAP